MNGVNETNGVYTVRKFGFLYYTENEDDDGYRVVEGETMEAARLAWVAQVKAEGFKVHLSAIREVK